MQGSQMLQIREESMQLLREQSSRLKMQSKEIELRDEQLRFLKETILALEQEKDTLAAQTAHWKGKVKQMSTQIANYNATVVQKIYDENQELLAQVADLQRQLEAVSWQRDEALGRLRESQGRLQSHSSQKQELSTVNQSLKEARSKQEKRVVLLEKQNRELQAKNIVLQRQVDESSSQIAYCSQQIDVLTQKHHDALKISEKKLKQTAEKMVPREEFERLEREAKDGVTRNKQLRSQLQRAAKENERLKFQLSGCRDKLVSLQVRQETRSQQLRIDIVNLSQSIKIGKRVAQFESEEHQTAASIYDGFRQLSERATAQQQQIKEYAQRLKEVEIQRHALIEEGRFRQVELERIQEAKAEEEQARQAEYEHRLMELGLRLKKEEIALAGLRHKEDELEALREQRDQEAQLHRQQNSAMGRTIQELRKENTRMSEQLASAIRLCEENLMNRECISYYKYVVQDLVGIVYYLHLHIMRARERTLKLYRPFIAYFLAIHPSLAPTPTRPIRKFKAAVHAVIAMGRIRRERGKGRGLQWYAGAAGERREKVENVGQHIEMLSSSILAGAKAVDLLRISQNIYKWRMNNYLKVKLPIGDDRKIISEKVELQLD